MRTPLDLLNEIQIACPCPADWGTMPGYDRVRHCDLCQKNVYNLSALTADESDELLERHGYDQCAVLYRREDGRVLTGDCPVGRAAKRREKHRTYAILAAIWVIISWASCYYLLADYFGWTKPFNSTRTMGCIGPAPTPPRLLQSDVGYSEKP